MPIPQAAAQAESRLLLLGPKSSLGPRGWFTSCSWAERLLAAVQAQLKSSSKAKRAVASAAFSVGAAFVRARRVLQGALPVSLPASVHSHGACLAGCSTIGLLQQKCDI